MDLNVLENELTKAYDNLILATEDYREIAERVRIEEAKLKERIALAYYNGEIQGKNATERSANERIKFETEFIALDKSKSEEALAYLEREVTDIEVKKLRDILRIIELSQVNE